jgi:hypothetical protein
MSLPISSIVPENGNLFSSRDDDLKLGVAEMMI